MGCELLTYCLQLMLTDVDGKEKIEEKLVQTQVGRRDWEEGHGACCGPRAEMAD
jgi:hypothetical protein